VTVEALREANELRAGQSIHPGLELAIPDGKSDGKSHGKGADKKKPLSRAGIGARAAKGEGDFVRRPKQAGVVHMVHGNEHFDAQLQGRKGKLNPAALAGLGKILQFAPTGAKTNVDPRLASLLVMVSDHFGGRRLLVTSGFRPYSPTQYTPHSNHNVGRAIDFSVEGVPNGVVRDYCRQFHDAGVGYYPNGTFVHLDVRSGQAFWIDHSRSGEPPRYDASTPHQQADEAARDVPSTPPEGEPAHDLAPGDGSAETSKP